MGAPQNDQEMKERVLGKVAHILDANSTLGGVVAIAAMWIMSALIFSEVISRTFFERSILFSLTMSEWLLVAVVLMGSAWTLKMNAHIRIGLLTSHLSRRHENWLVILHYAVATVVCVFLTIYAGDGLVGHYIYGTKTTSLFKFPVWWAWIPFFIGLVLLTLQCVANGIKAVVNLKSIQVRESYPSIWLISLISIYVVLVGILGYLIISSASLNPLVMLILTLIFVFGLILSGFWVFLSALLAGILGTMLFTSYDVGEWTSRVFFNSNASFVLTAIPLFLLMAELLLHSGATRHLYNGISMWVQNVPGRLLHSNVIACTIFAAISGSSAATCATVGVIAVPELERHGYDSGISLGSLAGAGTLGLLIPPSIAMIVYGAMTANSIGQLFIAGIIPGLMLSSFFLLYILFRAIRRPSIAPVGKTYSWGDKVRGLAHLTPIFVMIGLVLGLIYAGITTPTEAGAIGVVSALATLVLYRQLKFNVIKQASWSAVKTSCMIMVVFSGAMLLSSCLAYIRAPQYLASFVVSLGLSKYAILAVICFVYFGLGCVFEGTGMMVLTLPIIYPVVIAAGFDGIWFGILLVILIEMAQITPPVGFNLYVLQSISHRSIGMIVRNTIPFFLIMWIVILILIIFPEIPLILPKMMIAG